MAAPEISVVIPTQRRPEGLMLAARSILRQQGCDFDALELVIVDNDQAPSAKRLVSDLARSAPLPVRYLHVPQPGVSVARNGGLAAAAGSWIAFLDDDEAAPDNWLAELIRARDRYGADVVFGPVRARAPADIRNHRAYFERFFSREGPSAGGLITHHYGCGNSFLRRAALPGGDEPFSASRNQSGGEDNLLFTRMKAAGARFAWAPEAWVWEDPVPARLSLGYTIRRAFAYGQGPTCDCAAAEPPDPAGVAFWMAVGLAQSLAFGIIAAAKWLTGAEDRAVPLDRAARGLGKVLWWGPFRLHFYGRSA